MSENTEQMSFDFAKKTVIKGYPELIWTGKRAYKFEQYYPAQLKEVYGKPDNNGWMNKIYWGDNLQVMNHLNKHFKGKIKMIYIDPPFDSKADYKKKIQVKGASVFNDNNTFEEKQYGDIWTNDTYLQFMFERLSILYSLLADDGCILVHCDYRRVSQLRLIMDEIFGSNTDVNFRNEIIWSYRTGGAPKDFSLARKHDNILFYAKTGAFKINKLKERQYLDKPFMGSPMDSQGRYYVDTILRDSIEGVVNIVEDEATEKIKTYNTRAVLNLSAERVDYPTQKPEGLLELLMDVCTNEGDLVLDCFMGSGTTQAVALKNNRRFLGADINLGAINTTIQRLTKIINDNTLFSGQKTGFEVYNVNNYDFFRNPLEARDLLIDALEINAFPGKNVFDGEKDGRMIKIMPVNRIATKSDLQDLLNNLPYKTYEKRKETNPTQPVEKITLVCIGHEADLKASFEQQTSAYKFDLEILDILRDKADLQFKREAEVEVVRENGKLVVKNFYPLNLMQKLSLNKEQVEEWRQLVESIKIDFNYDGAILEPSITDNPGKDEYVAGIYDIPEDAGTIKIKITDLLSESIEVEV